LEIAMETTQRTITGWSFRLALGLSLFLIVTGLIFIFLPEPADQFLGMLNAGSDPARLQLVGIRQLVYGTAMAVALYLSKTDAILIIFGIGSFTPLADGFVAWSQTGMQGAMGHWVASIASFVLTWAMWRNATAK
jgi:uncharacterized protein YjeT (DUF2065 family)